MDEWSQLRQRRWSGSNARDAVFAQLAAYVPQQASRRIVAQKGAYIVG